jgi:hypothetical protein
MINARNTAFWDIVKARNRQLENMGFNPWSAQLSMEELTVQILREQASRAGRRPKADWLTSQICRIVDVNADISEETLRKRLSKLANVEFHDSDEMPITPARATSICYVHRGREKEILCSGLKDRLSRAKKDRAKRIARLT